MNFKRSLETEVHNTNKQGNEQGGNQHDHRRLL